MTRARVQSLSGLFLVAGLSALPARAGTVPTSTFVPSISPAEGSATSRLAAEYSTWAGSPANATSLVNGLRTGAPIILTTSPSHPGGTTLATTFGSPVRPMGNGNIRIALALAQRQLADQGVTRPTPDQLHAALVGGTLTTVSASGVHTTEMPGVLTLRSGGMGWGQVAQSLGYKLGPVVSGKAAATTTPHAAAGITTAGGSMDGGHGAQGHSDHGIVTAAGTTGGAMGNGLGLGHGESAGIVTGHGQGHGLGLAKNGK